MPCTVKNNSNSDLTQIVGMTNEFYPYAKKQMGFDKDAVVVFESDLENASNPLGKTAFYEPSSHSITVYVDGRHPKDIMRSLSHELVHHTQNCNGKFENLGATEEGYAQKDPYLRKMEEDAYRRGNLIFRDWENQKNLKENKKMKTSKEELINLVEKILGDKQELEEQELEEQELEEKVENPGPYSGGERQKKGVDTDGDGVPDGADEEPEDGSVQEEQKVEQEPLKEWWDSSIYNKLLKEYTKR